MLAQWSPWPWVTMMRETRVPRATSRHPFASRRRIDDQGFSAGGVNDQVGVVVERAQWPHSDDPEILGRHGAAFPFIGVMVAQRITGGSRGVKGPRRTRRIEARVGVGIRVFEGLGCEFGPGYL